MKRLVALMMLSLFSVAVLAGCNTVAGAGKEHRGDEALLPSRLFHVAPPRCLS